MDHTDYLTIGEAAHRAGVATSTLRFYEDEGLIESHRTPGNQRRFRRSELRRIAIIRAAQTFGLSLAEISKALDTLPSGRVPTRRDWERLSRSWRGLIDERIAALQRLRDEVNSCIGCGCLSLETCGLYNNEDRAASYGVGPRYLYGDDRGKHAAS
jgi:MerR family transcriptional regulator, redox-sensitive transcriptional activator SoxR